jgi:hypothetical protein
MVRSSGRILPKKLNNPATNQMKKLFTLTLAVALAFGSQSFAAEPKKTKDAPAEDAATKPKAADTEAPKSEGGKATPKAEGEAAKPKRDTNSFFGDVAAVDAKAKTITLKAKDPTKQRVLRVADATKITKVTGDKEADATISDVKPDTYITGSYKKAADGSLEAVKVTLGKTKPAKGEGEPKKKSDEEPKKK